MLIRELKYKILEYIFDDKTLYFLFSHGYDMTKRNLHFYTIKAFQQKQIKIACDLITNDNFDLDFSWVTSHLVNIGTTKEKVLKKFNVLSFLIYNNCPENLLIKVAKSKTCDLTLRDENYNTFIQLVHKKFPKYSNLINLLIGS